jgi:hypothetical protein
MIKAAAIYLDWLMFAGLILTCFLFVAFGQITVRKLRKNPATKQALGMEFASGWDILNAAQALSIPGSLSRKLESGALSFLYANSSLLYAHTTRADRILARAFFYSGFITVVMLFGLIALEKFGIKH